MRKIPILLSFIIVLFAACRNEFDITEHGPSIPIVYAILDHNDTVHYVRINKSFFEYGMAQNSDSILYGQILQVKVFVINKITGKTVKEINFEKYNITKDSVNTHGNCVFSVAQHYVYAYKGVLTVGENYFYRLEINLNNKLIAYATTDCLFQFEYYYPLINSMVQLRPDRFISTRWLLYNTGLIQIDLNVYYYEYNKIENRYYVRNVTASTGMISGSPKNIAFTCNPIIDDIIEQIEKSDTTGIERRYIGMMILNYYMANKDYAEQILINGGIGSNDFETLPVTNIHGGFGVFGTRLRGKIGPVFFDGFTREKFNELVSSKLEPLKFPTETIYHINLPDTLLWKAD